MAKGQILIVHHVEPMWERAFDGAFLHRVERHLRRSYYERTIFTTLEGEKPCNLSKYTDLYGWRFDSIADALKSHNLQVEDWMYGFAKGEHPDTDKDLIPVTTPHEWAYVYDWIKQLRPWSGRIKLIGGHRHECLADLEQTFDSLHIKYTTLRHLTY